MKPSAKLNDYDSNSTRSKREVWDEIQTRDPLMAETLKSHMKVFGKPVEIRVKFRT